MDEAPHDIPGLDDLSRRAGEHYQGWHWQGGFEAYFEEKLLVDPVKATRTAYQFAQDMIDHFGAAEFEESGEALVRYRLFDDPFTDGKSCVYGLDRTIRRLVKYVKAGAREEGRERVFLLHGPVGTAKTTLLDLLGKGLERYSAAPEGELLTFRWCFPADFDRLDASMGFHTEAPSFDVDEAAVTFPCQMRENPIALIPRPERRVLLDRLFAERFPDPARRPLIPHKTLTAELCFNCRQIFDYLMSRFQGDWRKVMRFVQVRRFLISEITGVGVVKVQPEGALAAQAVGVTLDENYRAIANLIGSLNLVHFSGHYVAGNRGLIHYSDIYKRPIVSLHHLLAAVEEHVVGFGEIVGAVDTLIVATTNVPEYEAVRKNPISKALRSRQRKIDVPYLLNYRDEQKIYDRGLAPARKRIHIAPHTTELAALWACMTRVERSELGGGEEFDGETRTLINGLGPFEKALLYADEWPERFDRAERELLPREARRRLRNEFTYEGMDGVPTRILQNLFADLCETEDAGFVHPYQLFAGIRKIMTQGAVNYDFLARGAEHGYHDFEEMLATIREHYEALIRREVEDAVIDVDDSEIEKRIRAYLAHVIAHNKKEKVLNPATGSVEAPDEAMMRRVEKALDLAGGVEDLATWRFRVISRATGFLREGTALDVRLVYRDLFDSLYRNLYQEREAGVSWLGIETLLEKAATPDMLQGDRKTLATVKLMLSRLERQRGYLYDSARLVILTYIRKYKRL